MYISDPQNISILTTFGNV